MAAPKVEQHEHPKPASAVLRATKDQRQQYLNEFAAQNPFATIEQAREALKERFGGVAVGTQAISDALREARRMFEAEHKARSTPNPIPPVPIQDRPPSGTPLQSVQREIAGWVESMKRSGVKLVAVNEDGSVRVEFAPTPTPVSG
jgi:hypothetical protein